MARTVKKKVKKSSRAKSGSKSVKRETEKVKRMISAERHSETSRALTDNFIALQRVMVNFSDRFDKLSLQISKLLELFEISAKSLARKDIESNSENKDTKKILDKLDNISQQAGLIGKGLVLIHETNSNNGKSHEGYEKGIDFREKGTEGIKPMFMPKKAEFPEDMELKNAPVSTKPKPLPPLQIQRRPPAPATQISSQVSAPKTREIQ
ncbi:MAG: hypothetical protein KKC96_02575 [Nanoarchaeota archaeon]|nr:hypothetical protein [Nanoarchaeota archaeon]MBU2459373.1 hypothetical protein [Nanoarchaeota archaeon]